MDLLLPVKWVIEGILVLFYKLFSFVTQAPDAGGTWVLSIVGSVLTGWRILRCNPWSQGGVDEVKPGSQRFRVNQAGFVLPKMKG